MPDPKSTLEMTISGYDTDAKGVLASSPNPLKYDMEHGPGSPITVRAFKAMTKRYIKNATDIGDTNRTAVVDFCTQSIFRVLGQSGCAGIRFWFCIPEKGEGVSLAMQGLDVNGYPLKMDRMQMDLETDTWPMDTHFKGDPRHEEKGNGLTIAKIIEQNKTKAEFVGKDNLEIIHEVLAGEWKR